MSFQPPENYLDKKNGGIRGAYGKPTDVWQMGAVAQVLCRATEVPDQKLADLGVPCGEGYTPGLNRAVTLLMHRDMMKRPRAVDLVPAVREMVESHNLVF